MAVDGFSALLFVPLALHQKVLAEIETTVFFNAFCLFNLR